jgi:DNA repair exonuclease SbcCD ATPase subunit
MEMLFHILKEIYAVLSPAEIFFIITLLLGMLPFIFKLIAKIISNRKAIASLMGQNDSELSDGLVQKIDNITSRDEHKVSIDRILSALAEIKTQLDQNEASINKSATDLELVKSEIENVDKNLREELVDIKHQLKLQDTQKDQSIDNMREYLQRLYDTLQKITSQLDKIDEFTKSAVPEFRSYHKELYKEIGDLSRDIALVERTIQNQINSSSSIKLR